MTLSYAEALQGRKPTWRCKHCHGHPFSHVEQFEAANSTMRCTKSAPSVIEQCPIRALESILEQDFEDALDIGRKHWALFNELDQVQVHADTSTRDLSSKEVELE